MSAPITKEHFNYTLGNMSYIDASYDDASVVPAAEPDHGLAHWIARTLAPIKEWHRKQAVLREMAMMTDRELADIGMSRADLPRVFDPRFAADHAERDYFMT